jgi:hypothetical protein
LPVARAFDHKSAELAGSFERSDGVDGKAEAVEEAKLFKDGKFGVGIPNGGNAPNGGIDGKPNGRPQGRSKSDVIDNKATV